MVFFEIGIIAVFEFKPIENYNGLNGSLTCPTLSQIQLESSEKVTRASTFNRKINKDNPKIWLSTNHGNIYVLALKKDLSFFSKKKAQTEKMSYNPNRQSNFVFDFAKVENYNVKNYHLMSDKVKTAMKLQQIKVQNDFINKAKKKEKMFLKRPITKKNKYDLKNINIECIYYEIESAEKFPWKYEHHFNATKNTSSLIKNVSFEEVKKIFSIFRSILISQTDTDLLLLNYFFCIYSFTIYRCKKKNLLMVGESNNLFRIFKETGELLCWLNLDHPLPLKWNYSLKLFTFWERIFVDAIKLIWHFNYKIKKQKSRFHKRLPIKSILVTLEQKYLGQVMDSLSTQSRRLSYLSNNKISSHVDIEDKFIDENLLFSKIDEKLVRKKNLHKLSRLTFEENKENKKESFKNFFKKPYKKKFSSIEKKPKVVTIPTSDRKTKGTPF